MAELAEHPPQARDFFVGRVQRGEACRHALDRGPHFDHLDDLLLRLAHDEDAAPRNRAQKPLLLEQRHRLADRRPAHAERLRQLTFVLIGCRTRGTLVTPLPSSGFALRFSDGSVATLPGSLCRMLTTSFLHPGGGASGVACASPGLRGLDSWVPV